jgi:hypothetical protein
MLDNLLIVARQADALLAAPSLENARRAVKANEHRAAARAALDLELERFEETEGPAAQIGGAK